MTARTEGGQGPSSKSLVGRATWTRAVAVCATVGLVAACARDRELEMPAQVPQGGPPMGANVGPNAFNPQQQQALPQQPNPTPPSTAPSARPPAPKSSATNGLPPAALPPLDPVPPPAPPASSAPPIKPTGTPVGGDKGDLAELYRAQDQCLSSCDQFACMKIAAAYKTGTMVPKDPLAGRRYAMHACQECGVAGPGVADQCPGYQLTPKASP